MKRALNDLLVAGIQTNAPFHLALFDNEDFKAGRIHTSWLESSFTMPQPAEDDERELHALIAAALAADIVKASGSSTSVGPATASKWLRATRQQATGIAVRAQGGRGWRRATALS
jgi:acetyl/propionyl-CoA carboxylase alpha subunit